MVYSSIEFVKADDRIIKKIRDRCRDLISIDELGNLYISNTKLKYKVYCYLMPSSDEILFVGNSKDISFLGIASSRDDSSRKTLETILFRIESINQSRSIPSEKKRGIIIAMEEIYKKFAYGKVE